MRRKRLGRPPNKVMVSKRRLEFVVRTWTTKTAVEQAKELGISLSTVEYWRTHAMDRLLVDRKDRKHLPLWSDYPEQVEIVVREAGKMPIQAIARLVSQVGPPRSDGAVRLYAWKQGISLEPEETTQTLGPKLGVHLVVIANWCEVGMFPGASRRTDKKKTQWFIPITSVERMIELHHHMLNVPKMTEGPYKLMAARLGLLRDPWVGLYKTAKLLHCCDRTALRICRELGIEIRAQVVAGKRGRHVIRASNVADIREVLTNSSKALYYTPKRTRAREERAA